ncbi:MAG: undecaprenyl-diphosphatase, partial [Candidatus Bathyarchaeia archaeon]
AIAGASIVEHWSLLQEGLAAYSLAGAIAAAISGYLAIKMVRRLLILNSFHLFSIYCFALGLITLTLFH